MGPMWEFPAHDGMKLWVVPASENRLVGNKSSFGDNDNLSYEGF